MRHFFIAALLLAGGLCSIAWFNPVYAKIKNGNISGCKIAANEHGA